MISWHGQDGIIIVVVVAGLLLAIGIVGLGDRHDPSTKLDQLGKFQRFFHDEHTGLIPLVFENRFVFKVTRNAMAHHRGGSRGGCLDAFVQPR